MEKKYTAT